VVVTTTILGDVVSTAVGDSVDVEVIMPPAADPHDFALSAKQAESMERADLLVTNGRNLEGAMADVIDAVSANTDVFVASDHLRDDDRAADDDAGDAAGDAAADDPHIWMDPTNVVAVVEALERELVPLVADADLLSTSVETYVADLEELDADIATVLDAIPAERRIMVTNHDSFGLFADRYDLAVVGTIIPSMTTSAEPSAAGLEALADAIREAGVPVVFAETTESARLADALASEVGEIDGERVVVVELFSGGLGEPGSGAETYLAMMRLNAERIAAALH
jgi:zinc/manganese transport system substrate-binding protein